jgi:hypothetical protein
MVLPRRYIQSMEVNGLLLVDTRKTCVTFGLNPASTPDRLMFLQRGQGKVSSGSPLLRLVPPL